MLVFKCWMIGGGSRGYNIYGLAFDTAASHTGLKTCTCRPTVVLLSNRHSMRSQRRMLASVKSSGFFTPTTLGITNGPKRILWKTNTNVNITASFCNYRVSSFLIGVWEKKCNFVSSFWGSTPCKVAHQLLAKSSKIKRLSAFEVKKF